MAETGGMKFKCKVRANGKGPFVPLTFQLVSYVPDFSRMTIYAEVFGITQTIEVEPEAEARERFKQLFN